MPFQRPPLSTRARLLGQRGDSFCGDVENIKGTLLNKITEAMRFVESSLDIHCENAGP
jgi:hypothetical protein